MNKKVFPVEEVRKYAEQGLSIDKIAEIYHTSRPTMGKFLRENDIDTERKTHVKFCAELDDNIICQKYRESQTLKQIGDSLGVSQCAIKNRLLRNEIDLRTNSEAHKKYHEQVDYFDNIDTFDKAYLLGFICADGWTTNTNILGIQVAKKDADIIYWFQKQMNTDKPIIEKENAIGLTIQNKVITDKLASYSIIPNKSLVLDLRQVGKLANITPELEPVFLLGYFDGDGGIYKTLTYNSYYQYSCSITGTYETCAYFKEFFDNKGFYNKRHKGDGKNNTTLQLGGRNVCKQALSKMYDNIGNLSFFFKRKYQLYCEL